VAAPELIDSHVTGCAFVELAGVAHLYQVIVAVGLGEPWRDKTTFTAFPTFQLVLVIAAATVTGGLIETGPLVTAVLLATPLVAIREKV
jgi:hypothetical protein